MKYIQQYDEKDCGPACLAMLAEQFGKKVSITQLRNLAKTDKMGTSLYGLIQAGKNIGIELTGVKVDSIEELEKNVDFPIIAHIINKQGYDHYIIIENIKDRKLFIVDPAKGKYKLNQAEFLELWTNIAVLVEKTDSFTQENNAPSSQHLFTSILKNKYPIIITVILLSIIINLVGIINAIFIKHVTDKIIPANLLNHLHILCISILCIYVGNFAINYIRYQLTLKLGLSIDKDMMKKYFHHVLNLPISFFDNRKSGEILQRFSDIAKIREALSSVTVSLFVDILMVIVGIIILYNQSPILLLVTVIFIPLFTICILAFKKYFKIYNQRVAENDAELSSYLIESFDGNQTIKSFQSEEDTYKKGELKFDKLISNTYKLGKVSSIQLALNNYLKLTITMIILWIGSYLVITNRMTLGSLIAFNALTIYYLDPIERLINTQPTIQAASVAARRVSEIIELELEKNTDTAYQDYQFNDEITLNNVSFQYSYRKNILNNINLTIPKGSKIAIVGESGSGKSTIGKLLTGLYSYDDGQIKFDNHNIENINLKHLRKHIGYVSQDNFLFSDTILNNLLYGTNKGKSMKSVIEACKKAAIYDYIVSLPNGFDTMLEQGGINLSGGQCQRLALARMFLKNPDIYVFDEATSALDSLTEYYVIKSINNLQKDGKTIIIISHKLNIVNDADIIYVIKNGHILEKGTHKDLIKDKNEYYHLWSTQEIK